MNALVFFILVAIRDLVFALPVAIVLIVLLHFIQSCIVHYRSVTSRKSLFVAYRSTINWIGRVFPPKSVLSKVLLCIYILLLIIALVFSLTWRMCIP
jgi:hypothetical protein